MSYSSTFRVYPTFEWTLRGLGASVKVTGNAQIDDTIAACYDVAKKKGGSPTEKAKQMGLCAASAGGAAAGTAACTATGVGATISPLCGMAGAAIGTFLTKRVYGYSTGQLVVGGAVGGICALATGGVAAPTCFMVAAELTEWISDAVGPIIDGIFNPGAARERDIQLTKARNAVWAAAEESITEMDRVVKSGWTDAIVRLKSLYQKMVVAAEGAASEVKISGAVKSLGFGPAYADLALQLVNAGAPNERTGANLSWLATNQQNGCERYGGMSGSSKDPYSNICPLLIYNDYINSPDNVVTRGGKHTREQDIAWYKLAVKRYSEITADFLTKLRDAEVTVATKIAAYGIAKKTEILAREIAAATVQQHVTRARSASARAAAAADAAQKSSSVDEAQRWAARALAQYQISSAAAVLVRNQTTTCAPGTMCETAIVAAERAEDSVALANAAVESKKTARALGWGVALAAAAAGGYFLLRD